MTFPSPGVTSKRWEMEVDQKKAGSFYTFSPIQSTQRSDNVHSGLTPDLRLKHATLDDFLNLVPEVQPIASPPMPGASVDPMMEAILEGVNELRKNSVTKETLKEFRELHNAEMRAFVRAEAAPLHDAVGRLGHDTQQLSKDAVAQFDRVGRLETRFDEFVSSGGASSSGTTGNPNPNDPGLRQIAFKEFPIKSTIVERIEAMKEFMRTNFSEIQFGLVDCFVNKDGEYTRNGFVEVSDRRLVRRVTTVVKDKKLHCKFADVKIKPGTTAIDRNRNWALYTAEDEIKKVAGHRAVTLKKAEGRGVYVDGACVFSQEPRFARDGVFHGEFRHLKLRK